MIRGIKKAVEKLSAYYNKFYNSTVFKFKNVEYKSFPQINGRLKIFKSGHIILGESVSINSGKNYNPIGGDTTTVFSVAPNAYLQIGNNTGISNCTIVCRDSVKIGNYVKIGGSVKIYDTDFHALEFKNRANKDTDIGTNKPIVIGDHAFIGAHSIILKGVRIGEKSIIGAGSVVTKPIPEGEIWGGNPAKFIKKIVD